MQSLLASAKLKKKSLAQKNQKKIGAQVPLKGGAQQTKLVQVSSKSDAKADLEEFTQSDLKQKLSELLQTQKQIHNIFGKNKPSSDEKIKKVADNLGFKMSDDMKQEASKLGSNRLIAHSLASRVLAQLSKGKSQEDIKKDMGKTKESLLIAQNAYFDKNPEAIAFIQLSDDNDSDDEQIIQIEEKTEAEKLASKDQSPADVSEEYMQLDNQFGLTNPNENEDQIQTMIDQDESHVPKSDKK